jgi:hypothetical protein
MEEEQQDTNMSDADSGVESDGVQPPAAADEDEDKELAESNGMDGDGEGTFVVSTNIAQFP